MNLYNWIELLLVPLTSIITWLAARRVRNNSTLQELQKTIDMLVLKNKELYETITQQNYKITELNKQIAEVRRENAQLIEGTERISKENAELKKQQADFQRKFSKQNTKSQPTKKTTKE